ncbi:MAG: tRNA (N6-isopentenyl adenosine(37)-C2)-methylthiotransferase MiaB [Clostridia bacterium]|uniref:tRNA-2-methylthio-N(6)-dimethylallyladenosine synthase n=1 Tax=Mogibacterium kristiansenii TaxID=2606708 RepID=A0A6N7X3K8_9FIRM|nr:tRNA (N6-isopentenyl adenosine(37)-C2)-methylthiotransferase MiaB [Mogibacterium kristiansenii]MEE0369305.1 tRNA (N6-isopentenyl adenosine(37)-C2)-methylthiotransferase MiaB [Clostridia bacterium]MST70080.1 tRNA (N6-isopentenyl adenosine(37)-C2)-methylthiotransferase MiaB [Mogibacterium kristiansenii]
MSLLSKNYHIITYGCQMNEHDSENIAGMLEALDYSHTPNPEEADVVVMNTCSVREHADKRFFGMLGQFKKQKKNNPDFIICVCGCMPQQPHIVEEIRKSFSWVDIVFGTQTIAEFPNLLMERIRTGKKQFSIIANNEEIPEEKESKREFKHKALVNITYGCNNFCTYCIVPYTRGREKSRSLRAVKQEIINLVKDGVKEVMLLGQNVNSFRDADGNNFAALIRSLDEVEGLERIRFMTSHPKDLSDELIACFGDCKKLCHNIHLPVQSGSDEVLRRMNRHYNRQRYMEIVEKLRATCPDLSISTDIIVGFPGETEEDFLDTLSLVREVEYDSAFTFIYSPRVGTPAAKYDDQIPEKIKHDRFDRLVEDVNRCSAKKNSEYLGRIVTVLVDGPSKNDTGAWSGRTDTFKLVNFTSEEPLTEGQMVSVRITETKTFSLDGEKVDA